jgi:hypothetical protein
MELLLGAVVLLAQAAAIPPPARPNASAIMAQMAANVERGVARRRQFLYHQKVRSSLVRANGRLARREKREYAVFPGEKGTEKKLESLSGEYFKGKQVIPYTEAKYRSKDLDIDGELIDDLTSDLVADKDSRDGIPHSLFPLRTRDLPAYEFTWRGETEWKGRRVFRIGFEPDRRGNCISIGGSDECQTPWKGEAWVDAAELQPVRIDTELAVKVPFAIRTFLGTNLHQTGFSITYVRVAPDVWFPATYGTEFKLNVLWGYKRTIALAMESGEFRRTTAETTITYKAP